MKPIAIFRHSPTEGPGHLAAVLDRRHLPWELIPLDAGAAVPGGPDGFAGLVFMGGPMSVNDDLPWIPPVLQLIRQAVAADVPVLGHCLGGQLMSKALGGVVTANPVKEIGWGRVEVEENPVARAWFGPETAFCPSTGTARHFPCLTGPSASCAVPTAPIRVLSSGSIWACNAMWK
jgi:GMP synthase-like glutamine amidotransferase